MLLLSLNLGIAVNNHYCGGELAKNSVSFLENNSHCESACDTEENTSNSNEFHFELLEISSELCCLNDLIEIQFDYALNRINIININEIFYISFISTYVEYNLTSNFDSYQKLSLPPPSPVRDLNLINQIFLI